MQQREDKAKKVTPIIVPWSPQQGLPWEHLKARLESPSGSSSPRTHHGLKVNSHTADEDWPRGALKCPWTTGAAEAVTILLALGSCENPFGGFGGWSG